MVLSNFFFISQKSLKYECQNFSFTGRLTWLSRPIPQPKISYHRYVHAACARNCDPRMCGHPYLHTQLWQPQSLAHCVFIWIFAGPKKSQTTRPSVHTVLITILKCLFNVNLPRFSISNLIFLQSFGPSPQFFC